MRCITNLKFARLKKSSFPRRALENEIRAPIYPIDPMLQPPTE
jgi:hypothetical protein